MKLLILIKLKRHETKWHDLFDKRLNQKELLCEAILDLNLPNYEISDLEWSTCEAFVRPFGEEKSKNFG
ncbi:hypothetical protein RCL_jg26334.t1 [Rhizophagus clarus]|uniref:Uncharacterized protein n=1 Tax=Rhizophagus clarus TaxID=94130 RepID=A0A8H3QGW6_9GLOM|nr:hypothetical protein RCL_jg26334.t1 [Rhizophagus clarus]